MFSKKCNKCGRKIEKNFEFCPHCGKDFRVERRMQDERDFGFLGKEDELFPDFSSMNSKSIPFGNLFDSLLKQVDAQMHELDKQMGKEEKIKREIKTSGFNISISSSNQNQPEIRISGFGPEFEKIKGNMKVGREVEKEIKIKKPVISEERAKQIAKLPRKEAETNVRRLSNKIIYEISLPGVEKLEDVIINKLENSIEIKAFSKNKVYFKLLPINLPIVNYQLTEEKLILELKTK